VTSVAADFSRFIGFRDSESFGAGYEVELYRNLPFIGVLDVPENSLKC